LPAVEVPSLPADALTGPGIKAPTVGNPAGAGGFLYVYCVVYGLVVEKFGNIGVGGRGDEVYGSSYRQLTAIVSRTNKRNFERNEENVNAHQRVIQTIFYSFPAVPMPFSTVLKDEKELEALLASRYDEFRDKLEALQEIVRPVSGDPTRELIHEALARSFASAVRIRQLSDEVSKLQTSSVPSSEQNRKAELLSETKNLREQLHVLRSIDKHVVATADKARAVADEFGEEGGSSELTKEVLQLRDELEGIRRMQSDARKLSDSLEGIVKDLMERAESARRIQKKGQSGHERHRSHLKHTT